MSAQKPVHACEAIHLKRIQENPFNGNRKRPADDSPVRGRGHDAVIKIVEVGQEGAAVKKRPSETILFIRMHGISRRTFVIYRRLPYL